MRCFVSYSLALLPPRDLPILAAATIQTRRRLQMAPNQVPGRRHITPKTWRLSRNLNSKKATSTPSVDALQLAIITIQCNSRHLTVLLQGLYYKPDDNVLVAYIGPVPEFKKIAFVLVLEKPELGLPVKYKKESMETLFSENGPIPREIFLTQRGKGLSEP